MAGWIDRQMEGQTDGQCENSIPLTNSVCRGIIRKIFHYVICQKFYPEIGTDV